MSDFNVAQFFTTIGFYILWLIIVLILWHFLWLSPYPVSLPDPRSSQKEPYKISNVFQALNYLYYLLFASFTPDFWLKNCGFEALAYIAFLRKMLILLLYFFVLSFLFGIPYSLGYSGGDILNSFNLEDDIYKYYFQMIFLIVFAAMYFQTLYKLKFFLSSSIQKYQAENPALFHLESRTIRLKGVLKIHDSESLRLKLREALPNNEKNSVVSCLIIPNTHNLLDLEAKRQDLILRKNHLNLNKSDLDLLKTIEAEIQVLREKGFSASGNAFICLNSFESFSFIIQRFSMLHIGFWRNFCLKLRLKAASKCVTGCNCCPQHQALLSREENEGILAYPLKSPEDINWRNLNQDSPISGFKRLGWNLLAILFMIFFTTPASLITVLGLTELVSSIIHTSTPEPGDFSNIVEKNLSPLLIIIVNQLLLYIINTLAYMKKHIKISKTQLTIFDACFIYMLFNSFIIPTLSMTTVESIFSFLSNESNKVEGLLETFYLKNTGSLFIILLMQSATFSFTLYILRLSDLILCYFNRKMVVLMREKRMKNEVWTKDETDNFQYGYFYANTVIFLIIVLVFSTTVPAISVSGLFYFFIRLMGDGYELMSNHRKEMESNGKIINRVLWCCCLGGLFFEILMIIYYSVNKLGYNVGIMVVILLISIVMTWRIEKVNIEKDGGEFGEVDTEEVKEWERRYRCPLIEFIGEREEKL